VEEAEAAGVVAVAVAAATAETDEAATTEVETGMEEVIDEVEATEVVEEAATEEVTEADDIKFFWEKNNASFLIYTFSFELVVGAEHDSFEN